MQLKYGEQTLQSFPKFKFPDSFSLSANHKHLSNMQESYKVTKIVVSYVETQRQRLQTPDQVALLIMDVFCGQKKEDVISLLQQQIILLVIYMFQPLDVTVNKY